MLSFRSADVDADRDTLLEMHCLGNYHSDQPWFRGSSFESYQATWLKTSQPESFLGGLKAGLADGTAIAEIWEEDGRVIGFLGLQFYDVEGYALKVAEISDIEVVPGRQRGGIGVQMMEHAEALARSRGAQLFRADTGASNVATQGLLEKTGFQTFRLNYEKRLD